MSESNKTQENEDLKDLEQQEQDPKFFVYEDIIEEEQSTKDEEQADTIEIIDDNNNSLDSKEEDTNELNNKEKETMDNKNNDVNVVKNVLAFTEFCDTLEAVQQLKREMSAHYKADMTVQDAANALISYTNASIEDLEVNKDNIAQLALEDETIPSYDELKETLVNKLAYYTNIANSYDKDVQKVPTFEDMAKSIDEHKDELNTHEHKIAKKVDEIQTQIDNMASKANDVFNNATKAVYQKGANVLSNIGSKVHKLQEKAETAKNNILGKWHEFKNGVKDAVNEGINNCKESYDKARTELSQKKEDIEAKAHEIIDSAKGYTADKFEDVKNAYNDTKVKASIAIDKAEASHQARMNRIKSIGTSVKNYVSSIGSKIHAQAMGIYGNFLSNQIHDLKQLQATYTNELSIIENSVDNLKMAQLQIENTISDLKDEMKHRIDEIQLEGPEDMAKQISDLANDFDKIIVNEQVKLKELKQQLGMENNNHDKTKAKLDKTDGMINEKQDQLDAIQMEM